MAEPITLTLNVGPNASIQAVGSAINDLTRVLEFAATAQRLVDRGALIEARVRARRNRRLGRDDIVWGDTGLPLFYEAVPPSSDQFADEFERIAGRQVEENAEITVQSLRYENPIELVILAGGTVVYALLRLIRDWPDRDRLNKAAVREYENGVIFRDRVRAQVLKQVDTGELPLTPELLDRLLTDDVANSLGALGDGPVQVFGLPKASSAARDSPEG